jgi:hypothetical protein
MFVLALVFQSAAGAESFVLQKVRGRYVCVTVVRAPALHKDTYCWTANLWFQREAPACSTLLT